MKKALKYYWPLAAALVALWLTVAWMLAVSLAGTEGHVVYVLDDAYIHMAMAKNLALHGVWGITRYAFSFNSSSPLWLMLLAACYAAFGVSGTTPLVLNLIFATALCATAFFLLKKSGAGNARVFICLLAIVFLTPLPTLVFVGMEHAMHALLALVFLYLSTALLSKDAPTRKDYAALVALAPLLALARYEGMLMVGAVAALLLFKKKIKAAVVLTAAGALPLVVLGLVSTSHGWYFLPNPVMLKTNFFGPYGRDVHTLVGLMGFLRIATAPYILVLLLGALAAFVIAVKKYRRARHPVVIMPALFAVTVLLHMQFSRIGHFYRYEAYLVVMGLFTVAAALPAATPKVARAELKKLSFAYYGAAALLLLFGSWPLLLRANGALLSTPRASCNIYDQQYQMGLFLKEYYAGKAVAANDVGAINFLADIKCIDLVGLASLEVARAKLHGQYETAEIREITEDADAAVAVVYKDWYTSCGGLPPEWPFIGSWKITKNVVCSFPDVQFYAISPGEQFTLFHNLVEFSDRLPASVEEGGPIVGPAGRSDRARRE